MAAVLLPIISFLLFTVPSVPLALTAGVILLISIPFAAFVAWQARKTNRRQLWSGITGAFLGVALVALGLFALRQVALKMEAVQMSLEARQAADSQAIPAR